MISVGKRTRMSLPNVIIQKTCVDFLFGWIFNFPRVLECCLHYDGSLKSRNSYFFRISLRPTSQQSLRDPESGSLHYWFLANWPWRVGPRGRGNMELDIGTIVLEYIVVAEKYT